MWQKITRGTEHHLNGLRQYEGVWHSLSCCQLSMNCFSQKYPVTASVSDILPQGSTPCYAHNRMQRELVVPYCVTEADITEQHMAHAWRFLATLGIGKDHFVPGNTRHFAPEGALLRRRREPEAGLTVGAQAPTAPFQGFPRSRSQFCRHTVGPPTMLWLVGCVGWFSNRTSNGCPATATSKRAISTQ